MGGFILTPVLLQEGLGYTATAVGLPDHLPAADVRAHRAVRRAASPSGSASGSPAWPASSIVFVSMLVLASLEDGLIGGGHRRGAGPQRHGPRRLGAGDDRHGRQRRGRRRPRRRRCHAAADRPGRCGDRDPGHADGPAGARGPPGWWRRSGRPTWSGRACCLLAVLAALFIQPTRGQERVEAEVLTGPSRPSGGDGLDLLGDLLRELVRPARPAWPSAWSCRPGS